MMSSNVSMRQEPQHINSNPALSTTSTSTPTTTSSNLLRQHQHNSSLLNGHSVLVEGKLLQGDALLEYAQQKGLCPKCVQHVTHKRIRKRLGMLRYTFEWIPLTVTDEQAGNYTVYKGYCLQPTCYTLEEAQIKLGERAAQVRQPSRGRNITGTSRSSGVHGSGRPRSSRSQSRRDLDSNISAHSRKSDRSTSIGGGSSSGDGDTDRDFDSEDFTTEATGVDMTDSSGRPMTPTNHHLQLQRQSSRHRVMQQQQQPSLQRESSQRRVLQQPEQLQQPSLQRQSSRHHVTRQQEEQQQQTVFQRQSSRHRVTQQEQEQQQQQQLRQDLQLQRSAGRLLNSPGSNKTTNNLNSGISSRSFDDSYQRRTVETSSASGARSHQQHQHQAVAPRTPSRNAPGGNSERPKVRRVPDFDILQQLCKLVNSSTNSRSGSSKSKPSRGVLSIASEADLWTILHKRYGEETLPASTISGRIVVLLNILHKPIPADNSGSEKDCRDPAWILLAHLTKQQVNETNNSKSNNGADSSSETATPKQKALFAEQVLLQVSNEFNHEDDIIGDAKRCAAQTLYCLLKNEEDCVDSPVLSALQGLSPATRHHWITVLLDMLMFHGDDDNDDDLGAASTHPLNAQSTPSDNSGSSTGTAGNLFVVWNLLLSGGSDPSAITEETLLLLKTIVGIAVSILSGSAEGGGDGLYSSSHGGTMDAPSILQAEAALGLLATAASRAGATALAGRQYECLQAIAETCTRYDDNADVLLQGAHAICHILASFEWYNILGSTELEQQEDHPAYVAAEQVIDVMMMVLQYQEKQGERHLPRPEELNRGACRLFTSLLECNEVLQAFVVRTCLDLGPQLVQSLVQMLITTETITVGESASDILVYLLNQDLAASEYLRNIPDIAALIVQFMDRYRDAPFIEENLCLIVAHLVSLKDHNLGQEISESGGLNVLVDLLLQPAPRDLGLIESVLRALIGTVSSIDLELLQSYQNSLCHVLALVIENQHHAGETVEHDGISNDDDNSSGALEVQLAALDALHCLCVRGATGEAVQALPAVVRNMEVYLTHAGILMRCCAIVRRVAHADASKESVRILIHNTGMVKMLLHALLIHSGATEFVLEGMATLKDLAAEPSLRDFDSADAEACLISLLEANAATHPDVTALAFAALNNVLVDYRRRPSVAPIRVEVVQHLIGALRQFPDDSTVWTNALLLLKSYTYRDDNLTLLRDEYSDDLIPLLVDSERLLDGEAQDRSTYIIRKLQ